MSGKAGCIGLCLALLAVAEVNALDVTVEGYNGAPAIHIDGKPQVPLFFYGNVDAAPDSAWRAQVGMAREAGLRFVSFSVPMPWPRPGEEADFDTLDRVFGTLAEVHPEALAIIRFDVMAPAWWIAEHPGEEMVWSDGQASPERGRCVSVASRAWRRDMEEQVRTFVAYCERKWGGHILGYHPCGLSTAEWFMERAWENVFSGGEEPMRRGFGDWALKKYGSVEALRSAWNEPDLDPETIRLPSIEERSVATLGHFRQPDAERRTVDFNEYRQVVVVEVLEGVARAIKDTCSNRKLVAVFYGYTFELTALPKGPASSGHMALGRLLRCPDVDIVASPLSYMSRGSDGLSALMLPVDSVRQAGKLYLLEDDTRTWLRQAGGDVYRMAGPDDLQATLWEHKRSFGRLLPRRLATWYMDLFGDGWLNDHRIWTNIGHLKSVYEREREQPVSFAPELAVIVDERSFYALAASRDLAKPVCYDFREEWLRTGAPVGIYLLSDVLTGDIALPAVSVFINAWQLDAAERVALHRALEGKTAVWLYGSGFLDDHGGSAENIGDLTGFQFEKDEPGPSDIRFYIGPLLNLGIEDTIYGSPDLTLDPRWAIVPDPDCVELACYTNGAMAAAYREGTFRSVYIGTTGCPAALLRNVLREAGGHVITEANDIVSADQRFLSVGAVSGGAKHLRAPNDAALIPYGLKAVLPVNESGAAQIEMLQGEVRYYEFK